MVTIGHLIAFLGAGLSVLLAGLGSTFGVGACGQLATGIVEEQPSQFGKLLVLQIIPGTQGIYGMLVAFLILMQTGLIGGGLEATFTYEEGWRYFLGAMPIALICLISAFVQAKVAQNGMKLIAKRQDALGQAITMAVMLETYQILCLLISFMIVMM